MSRYFCEKHQVEKYRPESGTPPYCKMCHAVSVAKYAASEDGKATRKLSKKIWSKTPTGKAYFKRHRKRWAKTPAGRARALRHAKRYQATPRGKEMDKRNRSLPHNKILHRLRKRVSETIRAKGGIKSEKTRVMLGCSISDFLVYLESRFEPGMTWENYGSVWHIDHRMPCAIFDLTKLEHQRACFHFSNLQPLFALENLRKNATVPAGATIIQIN